MVRANLIWVWSMLGWCIVTLAGARLKASVQFPPLRRMYQGGTCKRHNTYVAKDDLVITRKSHTLPPAIVVDITTCLLSLARNLYR